MEPEMLFITDDSRMRDGVLDETDKQILRQAGGAGRVMIVSPQEALKMGDAMNNATPRRSKPLPPGLRELKPNDVQAVGQAAAATQKLFDKEARQLMNDEHAAFIRKLRVDQRYTWRKIARACSEAWGTDWASNQLAGMALCEHAARWLLEDYRKPPWN